MKGDAFVDPTAALRFVLSSLTAVPGDGSNNNALLTDAARRLLQQLQGPSSGSSSRSNSRSRTNEINAINNNSHNGEVDGSHDTMKSAMTGLSSMTDSESNVMRTTATVVVEKLRDRLVERLQPLKQQQSSPQRRGAFP